MFCLCYGYAIKIIHRLNTILFKCKEIDHFDRQFFNHCIGVSDGIIRFMKFQCFSFDILIDVTCIYAIAVLTYEVTVCK